MQFDLAFDADNAAFDEDPRREVVRILREVAKRIERGDDTTLDLSVLDINGNVVGRFKLA